MPDTTVLGEGTIQGEGDLGALGAAIDAAGPGSLLELRLTLPGGLAWPEWIGHLHVPSAVENALRPAVPTLWSVRLEGDTMMILWEV